MTRMSLCFRPETSSNSQKNAAGRITYPLAKRVKLSGKFQVSSLKTIEVKQVMVLKLFLECSMKYDQLLLILY